MDHSGKQKTATKDNGQKKELPKRSNVWSNPALRMLGIPKVSLPSRNWMIFWAIVASIGVGIGYDKYEQHQIRKKWMDEVKYLGEVKYPNDRIARKLTVFIAPPPDDYLDKSLKLFRKYIKPVINSASLDLEVFSESRQGDIRVAVAKKVREIRIASMEKMRKNQEILQEKEYSKSWLKYLKDYFQYFRPEKENLVEEFVKRQDAYSSVDVLGLYKLVHPLDVKKDDELDPDHAGGVICIGRGAYKEYLNGLHEGLLGPLEKPEWLSKEENDIENAKKRARQEEIAAQEYSVSDDDEKENLRPVTKPFIRVEDYSKSELASELNFNNNIRDEEMVPVLFQQPIYVFSVPNLTGFANIPRRIYRFFTKRYLADDLGYQTTAVIYNKIRDFEFKDTFLAREEELEWPHRWVEAGKAKNSEWVQELVTDDRVIDKLRVYDPTIQHEKNIKKGDEDNAGN